MKSAPHVSLVTSRLNDNEIFWLSLMAGLTLFVFCWAIFSSPFNPSLYVRQTIFFIWTGLAHRWFYGLEHIGTPLLAYVSLVSLTSYLPFAFWGIRPDQLFNKIREEYNTRKIAEAQKITSIPVQTNDNSKSDAA
jgi:hypothetical protein